MTADEVKSELESIISEWEDPQNLSRVLRDWLKIRNEQGQILPLIPNTAQMKLLDIIIPLLTENKPIRLIILKARQQGISTLIQAIFFILLFVGANLRALTLGHELESSNNLFSMYDIYYKELPTILQPKLEFSNEKKKKYLASQCENKVSTAGKGEVGRSDTLQLLHLTEVAFYPDAKRTLGALLQAAKYARMIVIESTANGIGEEFYNMYQTAKDPKSLSDYTAIFLSWLDFPNYSKPFRNDVEKDVLLSDLGANTLFNEYEDEENILQKEFSATLEQLNWRRYMIVNQCQKDVKTFHQEYPRDDIEAFVASGRPFFNTRICNENYALCRKLEEDKEQPLRVGNLQPVYNHSEAYKKQLATGRDSYYDLLPFLSKVEFCEDQAGYIKIYDEIDRKSNEMFRYAAGVDVSEGLEQGDYDCIKILDRKKMNVCVTWHGHLDPDLFAVEHHKLQVYLGNSVYFGIERNNHGLSTIYGCHKLNVNLYYAQDFTRGYIVNTDLLGFRTTSGTRTPALNELNEFIREKQFTDYEKGFWSETLTFVKNAKGKLQAQNKDRDPSTKCYDDRIFAAMIMTRVHLWMPNYKVKVEDERPQWLINMGKDHKDKVETDFMGV